MKKSNTILVLCLVALTAMITWKLANKNQLPAQTIQVLVEQPVKAAQVVPEPAVEEVQTPSEPVDPNMVKIRIGQITIK